MQPTEALTTERQWQETTITERKTLNRKECM